MATSGIGDLVGRVLGDRYRLLRPLGQGASAYVYVAEDIRLARRVAVKLLRPGLVDGASFERFRTEAMQIAAFESPNIVDVFDADVDGGSPYLVTRLLEGGSLRALLDRGERLTPSQAALLGFGVASALADVHRRHVVHRDVKPANLLFDLTGKVRLADFGLARAIAESAATRPEGGIVGTVRYASPEQARGQDLDGRSDIYSLALVLVEATSGALPFAADTEIAMLMARTAEPLAVPDSTGSLRPVLEAAATIDPEDRLDARTLVRRLEAVIRTLPPPAPLPLGDPLARHGVERDRDPTRWHGAPGRDRAGPDRPTVLLDRSRTDPSAAWPDASAAPGANRGAPTWLQPPPPPPDGARAYEGRPYDGGPHDGGPHDGGPHDGGAAGDGTDDGPAAPPRRRAWPRVLLAVLVVIALAAVGTTAWLLTHRPAPLVAVPSLHGETRAEASAALAQRHLVLTVAGEAYDAHAPAGTVMTQAPAGGRLREHRSVAVTLSRGPQPVGIPAGLAGTSQSEATRLIDAVGLQVGRVTTAFSVTVPDGDVIRSAPASGRLLPGAAVALVVSRGKPSVTVPELAGADVQSYAAAAAALQRAHLAPSEQLAYSDTVAKGLVIITSPAPGASVLYGSPVEVEISEGPHYATVPSLTGDTVAQADQALSAAGFDVTGVTGNPSGRVRGTDPAAGRTVLYGASIQIVTSGHGHH